MERIASLLGLVCLALCGCQPAAQAPRPNVVLIVIDTLRADHLPFYGYPEQTAPFLSELAAGGAVFERALSASSWTAPATASIFTSRDPQEHGVVLAFDHFRGRDERLLSMRLHRIPHELVTLPEALQAAGYRTFAVTDNYYIDDELGFGDGFEYLANSNDRGADQVNAVLRSWREEIQGAAPYFLYLHYMDPHHPYRAHEPGYAPRADPREDAIARYDGEIRHVDARIAEAHRLFGWERDTLLIVTADHGTELWDHGLNDHGISLYQEALHVPLLLRLPGGEARGRRVAAPVSTLDVLPTIREVLGLAAGSGDAGRSLLGPLARDALPPRERPLFSHLLMDAGMARGKGVRVESDLEMRSVVRANWKWIRSSNRGEELFDLGADPHETRNLAAREPRRVAALKALVADYERALPRRAREAVDFHPQSEDIERLRSLGYIE